MVAEAARGAEEEGRELALAEAAGLLLCSELPEAALLAVPRAEALLLAEPLLEPLPTGLLLPQGLAEAPALTVAPALPVAAPVLKADEEELL